MTLSLHLSTNNWGNMPKRCKAIRHPWRAFDQRSFYSRGILRVVNKPVPVSHFVKSPFILSQVSLVLMGGLQSEALVVMVADPCPLWINKLTMFMNGNGGSSWRASWSSLNRGKLVKLGFVKCKKLVFVWRHDVEIYDMSSWETDMRGLRRIIVDTRLFGVCFWWWLVCVYWLRCCICKTNRSLWSQQLWSHCHHLLRVLSCVSAFIHVCLVGGWIFLYPDWPAVFALPKDTSVGYFICCCIYLSCHILVIF